MTVAFIGGGNMASAMIAGMIRGGMRPADIIAIDPNERTLTVLRQDYAVEAVGQISDSVALRDVIVIAVKPDVVEMVARQLSPILRQHHMVISIAAGITVSDLRSWLGGHCGVFRVVPNTPALIGLGVNAVFAGTDVEAGQRERVSEVLGGTGHVIWIEDEQLMNSVTAVSGSGPAYVYFFMETLHDTARKLGFNESQAKSLVLGTFAGAAQMAIRSDESLATLRERVTSNGGTTAAAIKVFEDSSFRDTMNEAILAADRRAKELGRQAASVRKENK